MPRIVKLTAVAAVFAVGALVAPHSPITLAFQGTPAAPPAVIASEVLGHVTPAVAENPELALGRVTIMPGAAIPVHYHAGIQIGVAVQGELTYTDFSAKIAWYRGDSPTDDPRIIEPGETVVARVGDALVESPGAVHQGRNDGDVPLIIYLSTFFPAGAPSAVIVDATPIP
ncbi:MAG: Cupin 2, conserved barrel domain protein [Thermomicrobiales bacterium]|nr:Cupin 2, conserved barrel domain protein [Thermomicrobiales bacterium]